MVFWIGLIVLAMAMFKYPEHLIGLGILGIVWAFVATFIECLSESNET